ncbi:unannotated protein [freshwater metagenome]|uniref:Unannotated protein n=1 Tax=freshwater metagenome TaxID=449393 RepID=A0A6J6GAQ0_9ZZZZ|nr:hypothetical protein [Actinomycetota bacterium]MSZ91091.1 hypothetical protein [Actinomycetota bacterium]
MKRFLSLVLISSLLFIPSTYAAPSKIAVKALKLITTINASEDISGFAVSGKTIILFGTAVDRAFARAVDINGVELWRVPLDPDSPSIASVGAVDGAGNIWIAGATSLLRPTPAPSASLTPINPDNVVNSPDVFNAELSAVALWKIPIGTSVPTLFSAQQSTPVLVTGISVDKSGASIVGLTQTPQGSAGFVISTNDLGEFGKPLLIGAKSTTLDAVVRHSDSTLTVTGSSGETIGGKKLAGVIDGIIVKISKTNTILKVVRSSAIKAERNWNSATSTLLLGGSVTTGSKIESAVTKFSSTYTPTWTYRFLSTGPVFTLGSTYAFFNSTGTIVQLSNWKPKKSQPILLTFDSKGLITSAYSAPVDQKEVIGLVKSKELGVLCMSVNSELFSIYALA